MNKRTTLISFCSIAICACTTPPPTYRNPEPSPNNAHVMFESDFELHTHFSANIDRSKSSCGKYETVGYLLKADSFFIYDKPNLEINITVPADRLVGVDGYHFFSDPGYRSSCSPPGFYFLPEQSKNYVVKMNAIDARGNKHDPKKMSPSFCFLSIHEIQPDGNRTPVLKRPVPACQ